MSEIEKDISILSKYHDSALLKLHVDFLENPQKYQINGYPNEFIRGTENVRLALDDAIEAMKKQIPKKIAGGHGRMECPSCGASLNSEYGHGKYCEDCGQRLED